MNKKQVILNKRDLQVFRFIDKYRVASAKAISLACGFNSIRYVEVRIKKLVEYDFLRRHTIYLGYPHFFSLTTKALREIEIEAKAYKPSHTTAMHYVGVAETAAYIAYKYALDVVSNFFVDKDFYHNKDVIKRYQLDTSHKPDIIFTRVKDTYFVEFERSRKGKKKILGNILMNYLAGVHQIWVIDGVPFEDIKKECARNTHYQGMITFLDYSLIAHELRIMGGVKE